MRRCQTMLHPLNTSCSVVPPKCHYPPVLTWAINTQPFILGCHGLRILNWIQTMILGPEKRTDVAITLVSCIELKCYTEILCLITRDGQRNRADTFYRRCWKIAPNWRSEKYVNRSKTNFPLMNFLIFELHGLEIEWNKILQLCRMMAKIIQWNIKYYPMKCEVRKRIRSCDRKSRSGNRTIVETYYYLSGYYGIGERIGS